MENSFGSSISSLLTQKRVSRRDFIKFCAVMTGTLGLPASMIPKVARALETAQRPPLVWLEYQDCAGCSESLLRANQPTVAQLVLDTLSVNYHETIMAPSGKQAEKSLQDTISAGGYLTVVEGSIPTKDNGIYCCVGGRTAVDILNEVAANSVAIIAVGACAFYGGWPSTTPNPTEAKGVKDIVTGVPIVNMAGCPYNVDNLTAVVVHYLTFGSLPQADDLGRPLFAYGRRIHDNCERRGHFDAGEFVRVWDDEGHRNGWCLYQMGCKGPVSYQNCPTIGWNQGTSWPVGAGHGCIACANPNFWETAAYETVPIFEVTPPSTFPTTQTKEGISPAGAGAIGAAAGLAVGIAGAVAVRQLTKES
jgi:hydrogenase small subunit